MLLRDLLLWKDPVLSLSCFAGGLVFLWLVAKGGYTLATLLSYALLLQLGTTAMYVTGRRLQGSYAASPPSLRALVPEHDATSGDSSERREWPRVVTAKDVQWLADAINGTLGFVHRVARCEEPLLLAKVAALLALLSQLGRVLDGITLLGVMHIFAFVGPSLYEKNAAALNRLARLAAAHVRALQPEDKYD
jgi:hypothetical protein